MAIYQLKITLQHTRPPVWRRIQVKADTKLGKLHRILQEVMGWTDSHMHAFRVGHTDYGATDPDFPNDMKSERNIRLDKIATEGDVFIYEYDFGDGWIHEIKVEKALNAEPAVHYPVCLAGKRACPPEDCGGPWGYDHLLQVLRDPKNEEYEELSEWLGGELDPEAFDPDEVNKIMKRIR